MSKLYRKSRSSFETMTDVYFSDDEDEDEIMKTMVLRMMLR